MQCTFDVSSEGLVDLTVKDMPILSHAFRDSLGSRPPRGAPQDGPSTYWLDDAITKLRARLVDGQTDAFASGNVTYLQLREGMVEARFEFDPPDSESFEKVDPEELLTVLIDWRQRVLDVSPTAAERVPPPPAARPMPPKA